MGKVTFEVRSDHYFRRRRRSFTRRQIRYKLFFGKWIDVTGKYNGRLPIKMERKLLNYWKNSKLSMSPQQTHFESKPFDPASFFVP